MHWYLFLVEDTTVPLLPKFPAHTRLAKGKMIFLRALGWLPTIFLYQFWTVWCSFDHSSRFSASRLNRVAMDDHTFKLYGHSVNRWLAVSNFRRQRGQKCSFSKRRNSSLSAVKMRSSIKVQMKNLHLAGAHLFQTIFL
jgi:hypothetical protein